MSENNATRYRNFATVIYPESATEGWLDILRDQCIPFFLSPLHDKDVNPDGTPKKPHYHLMLCFDGKKSKQQIIPIVEMIGGVGLEVVQVMRGYARYLCHLDNPEKYQYSVDDVVCGGGLDYAATIGLPSDKYKAIREMMAFCEDNQIDSFYELSLVAAESHYDWFRVLADSGSVFMKEFLKSKSWTLGRVYSSPVKPKNGDLTNDCVEGEQFPSPR